MKPLPPARERELIRLADQLNALDLSGLNPVQGMVKVMGVLFEDNPLMNWDDVKSFSRSPINAIHIHRSRRLDRRRSEIV